MDEIKMLQEIKTDVALLKQNVEDINHKLTYIEVKNGGGMLLKLRRNEYFQKVYDKPDHKELRQLEADLIMKMKNMIKEAPINSLRVIIRDLTLIGGMVTVLLKLFGVL